MNERAHVEYFDWLRIIAALSVIFMHTAAGPLRAGINTGWHLLNVCTSLAFTAVPLFFMMSGYLLMTSRKTADISVLLRHRLPRLVVPLAGWTVVAVLWQMFLAHTLTPGAIWAQLVAALNGPVMVHFWYLYTLIALYVLSPILYGGIRTLGKSGRGVSVRAGGGSVGTYGPADGASGRRGAVCRSGHFRKAQDLRRAHGHICARLPARQL